MGYNCSLRYNLLAEHFWSITFWKFGQKPSQTGCSIAALLRVFNMPKCIAFKIKYQLCGAAYQTHHDLASADLPESQPLHSLQYPCPNYALPPSVAPISHLCVAPYILPALCMADSFSLSLSRSQLKRQYLQKAFPTNRSETDMAHPSCPCPINFFISFTHLVHLFTS